MASNRNRCDAEQSEAGAQAYRPVLQGDRQECLSLPDAVAVCAFKGMFQREAREVKTGIFYETKPTSLLESTKMLGKRYKKPPENGTKSADRGVMQQLLERFGRCKCRNGEQLETPRC